MTEILVIGATGSAGRRVVAALVEGGHAVRALVRDAAKTVLPAEPEGLGPAPAGRVEAVYLMWPGLPVRPRVVELIARRPRRVVHLSADVADLADDEPAVVFHQEIERLIRHSGLDRTFVRAIDFADARLRAWASFTRERERERVTGTVREVLGRPPRDVRDRARDRAADFRQPGGRVPGRRAVGPSGRRAVGPHRGRQ
ncbi:hypothetical protein GCM10010519_24970 [Streptomyces lactacystinicus]